jgi:hypothetical protein
MTNQMEKRNKIIVFLIYFSIFINSHVFFTKPFEFYIGYVVYILLLPRFAVTYGINRNFFFIFLILLATGCFNIFLGNNTTDLFFKVFLGLTLSYFFYYYVIADYNYNIEQLFKWYLKGCYIASLIGAFQFVAFQIGWETGYAFGYVLNKWGVNPGGPFGIRINSIFAEPTHLAAVLSGAFFVSIYNLMRKETYGISRTQSLVIIAIYILSFSGLAQIGIFIALLFMAVSYGLLRYIIVIIPLLIVIFNVLYKNVPEFRERYDSLVNLSSGQKFELGKTHGSSFILYNNYHVARENFKTNFVFGTGVGSHPLAFDKYSLGKGIKQVGLNQNAADANSMFIRLLSETGLFGVGLFMILIVRCYVRRNEHDDTYHWLISNAILVMILLNLFRQGHYFLNGFPFFVLLYYYTYESYQQHRQDLYAAEAEEKARFVPPPLQNLAERS